MQKLVDKQTTPKPVAHIVAHGGENAVTLDLHDGESALVGQAAGCQLRIENTGVAPHQCMLELRDGLLMIDNWSEDESTFVNGIAVEEQVNLSAGDTVSFDCYTIQFKIDSPFVIDASDASTTRAKDPNGEQLCRAQSTESVDSSTMAVLYSEIGFLQRELEQRDAALAQYEMPAAKVLAEGVDAKAQSTRLNDLLAELDVADSRLLNLTDELRLLEELRAAEQEEQRQLAVWVNEVETLIAKREAEQLAQMDILRELLKREREDRLFCERRAESLSADKARDADSEANSVLMTEHETLREQLRKVTEKATQLELECEKLRAANVDAEVESRIREAVRVERLELAQERAKISRREHDLSGKLRQVECQLEIKKPDPGKDVKIQVFREKLKEFQHEETDCGPASVGQRLVKLWQTLDGHS